MSVPMIVVFPRGQLYELDKARLEEAGVIAIEADDPKAVVQMELSEPLRLTSSGIAGDLIVRACLAALAEASPTTPGGSITGAGLACHSFVKQLADAMNSPKATGKEGA